jgi:hypothetical protein
MTFGAMKYNKKVEWKEKEEGGKGGKKGRLKCG